MEKEAGSQQSVGKIGGGKRLERDKLDRVELVRDEKKKNGKVEFHTSGVENEGRGQAAKEPLLQKPRNFLGHPKC